MDEKSDRSVEIFGQRILAQTMPQAVAAVEHAIETRERLDIGVVNAAKLVNMAKNAELKQAVMSADAVYADGMAVVWASKILGDPLPERVAGIDLMHAIFASASENKFKVFCLGASQEVLNKVCDIFQNEYPGADICGSHNGYFQADQEKAVAQLVKDARPDILFVAITSPKKEQFMARWADFMEVPVVHGVGGSFDVVAGVVKRAPEIWQKMGLEWLYRLKQEPRRMWKRYLITNTVFCWMLLAEYLKGQPKRT